MWGCKMLQLNYRFQYVHGPALFLSGLVGDCMVGMLFLTRGTWHILLWHVPFALLWALGVNFIAGQGRPERLAAFLSLNKWGLTALLLGVGTFPGFGSCMYSTAFLLIRYLFSSSPGHNQASREPEMQVEQPLAERVSPPDRIVQPLVDDLYEGDTEVRRAVVAKLSRSANPDATQLLRQLLSDAKAEIRSDASIALARLDDEMSDALNLAFEKWSANPADLELTLTLADRYYHYATSNVLDKQSQRLYLVLARDLLAQMLAQEELKNTHLWLKLAHIRQRLGELPEALQDALHALQLQPDHAEAALLAMELAFRTHDWDILVELARRGAGAQVCSVDKNPLAPSFQWWATLPPKLCGGAQYE